VSLDDDIQSEWFRFATVLLHENPSSSQLNANRHADNEPSLTEQDQIHACHCISLPIASQNTQYYLQAGYGLACAMASAEMALFEGALSFAVRSVGGVSFAVRSIGGTVFAAWRRVFCGSVRWGRCLCGLILSGPCLLRFDHLEAFLFGGIVCAV
jgi:hypothetical protein